MLDSYDQGDQPLNVRFFQEGVRAAAKIVTYRVHVILRSCAFILRSASICFHLCSFVLFNLGLSFINMDLSGNPPACRRVLWIVLVSIACVGFYLRLVSPRGFFDSLTLPPPLKCIGILVQVPLQWPI